MRRALKANATAAASHLCSHPDSGVAILGTGALRACVNAPGAKSAEELVLLDPTSTVFTIDRCTGGLNSECLDVDHAGETYFGELEPNHSFGISYNATAPVSSARYTPNSGKTILRKLLPVFGIAINEVAAFVVPVGICADRHGAGQASPLAGVAIVIRCIFETGFGPELKIGPLSLEFLGASVAEKALKDAASKLLDSFTTSPGGTISLTTVLPAHTGGSATPSTATTPTIPNGATPSPTPEPEPTPTPSYFVYFVENTCRDGACGLHLRAGPGYSSYASLGVLGDGSEVQIVCQTEGETVGPSPSSGVSSSVWDKLTSGAWVSDLYIDTPGFGTWTPTIPRC